MFSWTKGCLIQLTNFSWIAYMAGNIFRWSSQSVCFYWMTASRFGTLILQDFFCFHWSHLVGSDIECPNLWDIVTRCEMTLRLGVNCKESTRTVFPSAPVAGSSRSQYDYLSRQWWSSLRLQLVAVSVWLRRNEMQRLFRWRQGDVLIRTSY